MINYEQKYKEALEWMKSLYNGLHGATKEEAEKYFPELKESEDEKIRKAIIESLPKYGYLPQTSIKVEEAIAWLEKQGEQKHIWSKEDEIGFSDTLWAIQQARTIAKDENDMGNLWYAEDWLKSLKERLI